MTPGHVPHAGHLTPGMSATPGHQNAEIQAGLPDAPAMTPSHPPHAGLLTPECRELC